MLTVYCDESGTHDGSPNVVVAGYVSSARRWNRFHGQWKRYLAAHGMKAFHATDLASQKKEYAGWSRERSEIALAKASEVITANIMFGMCAYTETAACEEVFPLAERVRGGKFHDEYAIAGILVIMKIVEWAREHGNGEPIKFVFEDGGPGRGKLREIFDYWKKIEPLMGSLYFEKKGPDFVQLCAADSLVHLMCQAINRYDRDGLHHRDMARKLMRLKVRDPWVMDRRNLPAFLKEAERLMAERAQPKPKEFEKFERLTEKLVSVPKDEVVKREQKANEK